MAIITLKVSGVPVKAKHAIAVEDMAVALAAELYQLVNIPVDDSKGFAARFQVDRVELVTTQLELGADPGPDPTYCRWCSTELTQLGTGRPAEFCSDAHRQAEYRHRHNLA